MQVSWINPEDVASLAESLRTPPAAHPASPALGVSHLEAKDVAALTEALQGLGMEFPEEEAAAEPPIEESPPVNEQPQVESKAPPSPRAPEAPPVSEHPGGPDLNALRQRLQEIRERAVDAGLLPAPQTVVEPPAQPDTSFEETPSDAPQANALRPLRPSPFQVPLGSVMARLEAFAAWAQASLETDQIFVVDDRGDLLWGPQDQAGLILSTLLAVNAAARASARSACESLQVHHQELSPGLTATIIPCDTRLGLIQVAITAPQKVAADEADFVRDALTAAMDAQEPEGA